MRDISAKLPANLGMSGSQVQRLLDGLTDHALRNVQAIAPRMDPAKLPAELRLRNGQSALEAPGGQRYAAPGTPAAEREMIRAAQVRGAFAMDLDTANALLAAHANGEELGADQRAAVQGIATSGAQVETLLAAAGTGKSYVVSSLDKLWSANGQRLFGLAPSQSAADVLRDEGVTSANVDAWLLAQRRLAGAKEREEDSQYRLRTGDLVVVDEAGMASTTQLLEVQKRYWPTSPSTATAPTS
jgi:hypothetical protein